MKNNSILIITNNPEVGKNLNDKIKLLRECDTVKIVSYIESISVLNSTQPSLILLYCGKTDNTGIVKEIRSIKALDKVPIIFVMDSLVEDLLFYAFDNGIDDFFFLTDEDSIILMRIFLTMHKAILYKQIEINNEILISANILEKQTGIYKKEQAPIALRNFFSQSIEENLENTVFMYLKPMPIDNKRLNMNKIATVVKSIPRGNDIVAYGKGAGFYLVLYNSGISGAKSVFTRIKNSLASECKLYANAAEISTSFEEMEPVLFQRMKSQIEFEKEFNYLYDISNGEMPEDIIIKDETGKKFNDFKKEFFESFEKITSPVFSKIKAEYKEAQKDFDINYNLTDSESIFTVSKDIYRSELKITYPSYIKVIVDIKHYKEDNEPTVRRLTFDFEDFSEEKLTLLLKDMIKEFEERLSQEEAPEIS